MISTGEPVPGSERPFFCNAAIEGHERMFCVIKGARVASKTPRLAEYGICCAEVCRVVSSAGEGDGGEDWVKLVGVSHSFGRECIILPSPQVMFF